MEEKQMSVEDILKAMEQGLGEEPRPMVLMSKLIPEWIPGQAQERKFVMELPHIPPKYKHLIMIAASAAVGCHLCTKTFIKLAHHAGVTKDEIAEPFSPRVLPWLRPPLQPRSRAWSTLSPKRKKRNSQEA